MEHTHRAPERRSLIARALDWWRESHATWQRIHELELLSDVEIARMARDIGVTPDEFLRLVSQPNGSAALLERRLAALDLDTEEVREISTLLFADLQRTCALCADKARCEHDLDHRPESREWESYCPNAGTLRTLA